jgi:tetratricopeptide (TPR) repeat protein
MGRNEEAMADFDAVLRMQPHNSHALFRRGFLWKRLKKYDEAAQDFEDAKQAVRTWLRYASRRGHWGWIRAPPVVHPCRLLCIGSSYS